MGGSARNQGNQADYVLGTAEGWDAFGVVRWHGVEEIGRPYQYDITLQRTASKGPVDLDKLLDTAATFQIASQGKWRPVHGIIGEAEEIDRTKQIILYRVLLVPHFWRASGSQKNQVEGARTHTVGGDEHVTVNRDWTTHFKLNEHHTVDVSRDTHIKASELHEVDVYRKTRIGGNDDLEVKGWRNAVVEGGDTIDVHDQRHVEVHKVLYTKGQANIESDSDAAHVFTSKVARFELTEEFVVNVKGCELRMTPGAIHLKNGSGQAIMLSGGKIKITGADTCTIDGGTITVSAHEVATLSGGSVNIVGAAIDLGPKK